MTDQRRTTDPRPAGVILAGGQSRRFGSDKPLALLHGRPLIAHVIAALAPQTRALAIASGATPGRFAAFGLPELADPLPDAGPLAGILAGLAWAATLTPAPTHLLTAPADSPFLPADLAHCLAQAPTDRPVMATTDGNPVPVVGLWPLAVGDALAEMIASGVRRVRDATVTLGVTAFPCDAAALSDMDTPADLARAETALTLPRD